MICFYKFLCLRLYKCICVHISMYMYMHVCSVCIYVYTFQCSMFNVQSSHLFLLYFILSKLMSVSAKGLDNMLSHTSTYFILISAREYFICMFWQIKFKKN